MLSSVRARAVKRKIIKLTSITPLPPPAYFNAASHIQIQIRTQKHTHTQVPIDTHTFTYSAVHAGA